MKKQSLCFLILLTIGTTTLFGQDFQSIEDLKRRFFERVLTIRGEDEQVDGYVVYYMKEKQRQGIRTFAVRRYDRDLETSTEVTLDVTKQTNILSTAFNGENLCVLLGDARKKTLKAVTYDQDGVKQGEKNWTLDRWFEANAEVYPSQSGFYLVRVVREKKTGFELSHLTDNLDQEWSKSFVPDKGYIGMMIAKSVDDKFVFIKQQGPSVLSKRMTVEMMIIDEADGSTAGKLFLYDGTNTFIPSAIRFDEAGNVLTGGMYFEGVKYRNTNSKGVFLMRSSLDGESKEIQSLPWKGEMQQYLSMSREKGFRIDAKNKIIFEDIILHPNGIQLIGEVFSRPAINLLALPDLRIGDGSGRPTLFTVKDIFVFQFDNSLDFQTANMVEKKEISVACYPPYASMGGLRLAQELQRLGYLNYRFTIKENPEDEDFTLISTNQGDMLDNIKKGVRYSVSEITKDNPTPEQSLVEIAPFDDKTRIRSYGILRNNDEKLLIYYFDAKYDAVRLYLDEYSK